MPFLRLGVPATLLIDFDYPPWHTADDTLDKVDPETLRQNVAAWTAMLATLSGGIEPEPKRAKRR